MTKKILTVALAVLMLLTMTFAASAQVEVTKLNVRGTVADANISTSSLTWNYQNFAGFFYDLKNNISTEQLTINQSIANANLSDLNRTRTIPERALIYTTNPQPLQFKMNEKENVTVNGAPTYQVVGWQAEKWVAIHNVGNKLAKLAFEMDKEDKKTMTTGETWSLGSGYEININAVDARATPRQVWFTLKKDGAVIDEGIGQGATAANKQDAVFYKTKTILGETDALLFTVYVDSIFSGATSDMVQFKYAWLVDESSAKEISGSDTFGAFEVTQATTDGISMNNKNTVSLSQNSATTLMGNMKFKIADNKVLRFYPAVDYKIGNVTPVTTGTAVTTPKGTVKATAGATQTQTVVPTTPKPVETGGAQTPKPVATTPTEPGFELVFAIAGLLAVAYLVLRQRK